MRSHIGPQQAGTAYTSPAWTMNLIYARLKPRGLFSTFFFNSVIRLFRGSAWMYYKFCRNFRNASRKPVEAGA